MSIHFAPPSVPKASIGSWGAADRGAIFFRGEVICDI